MKSAPCEVVAGELPCAAGRLDRQRARRLPELPSRRPSRVSPIETPSIDSVDDEARRARAPAASWSSSWSAARRRAGGGRARDRDGRADALREPSLSGESTVAVFADRAGGGRASATIVTVALLPAPRTPIVHVTVDVPAQLPTVERRRDEREPGGQRVADDHLAGVGGAAVRDHDRRTSCSRRSGRLAGLPMLAIERSVAARRWRGGGGGGGGGAGSVWNVRSPPMLPMPSPRLDPEVVGRVRREPGDRSPTPGSARPRSGRVRRGRSQPYAIVVP